MVNVNLGDGMRGNQRKESRWPTMRRIVSDWGADRDRKIIMIIPPQLGLQIEWAEGGNKITFEKSEAHTK